jgi:hypothetical protein
MNVHRSLLHIKEDLLKGSSDGTAKDTQLLIMGLRVPIQPAAAQLLENMAT